MNLNLHNRFIQKKEMSWDANERTNIEQQHFSERNIEAKQQMLSFIERNSIQTLKFAVSDEESQPDLGPSKGFIISTLITGS